MSKFWSSGASDDATSESGENASSDGSWDDDDQEFPSSQHRTCDTSVGSSSKEEFYSSQTPDQTWRAIKTEQIFQQPPQSTNTKPPDCTRLVCISDTHSRHRQISHFPAGDVLIHAGDFTLRGELQVIQDLTDYFGELSKSFSEIIAIAGNHDKTLHRDYYLKNTITGSSESDHVAAKATIQKKCVYLQDSSHKLHSGTEVYGSPWTPEYCGWAFMLDRGKPIREKWKEIPTTADVLITHGPPLGRGDYVPNSGHVGCFDLMEEIQQRVKPRVNIFGHIHEGYGTTFDGNTLYVNVSSVDIRYFPLHFPVVIDVPHDRSQPAMVVPPTDSGMTIMDISALCESNGWSSFKASLDDCDLEGLTKSQSGEFSFLEIGAFNFLCGSLRLTRQGQIELAQALRAVHARSFPP